MNSISVLRIAVAWGGKIGGGGGGQKKELIKKEIHIRI
jgi:hypothetical protein